MRKLGIQAAAQPSTPEPEPVAAETASPVQTTKAVQKAQAAVPSNGNGPHAPKAAPVKSTKKVLVSAKPVKPAKNPAVKNGTKAAARKKTIHKPAKPLAKKAKSR
jgi:hypothetical protein